jgi:hypothetical protein
MRSGQLSRVTDENTLQGAARHLHAEPDRVDERPAAQGHPQPRPVPVRAALKVLYLAVRNLDEFRSASVGTRSSGWTKALQGFTIYFEGRIRTP